MKVLILTSSTGGGHDMRANSLKAWSQTEAGIAANLDVSIHQTLESTHTLYRFGVNLYNFIQKTYPLAHHLYFQYLEKVPHFDTPGMIQGREKFQEVVRNEKPDVVLSTHAHLNHGFFQLAKESLPAKPPMTVTYCGELYGSYGFSRRWVNPQADHFLGAVKETCEAANRLQMPDDRNHCAGFLLRPHFYQLNEQPKDQKYYLKRELQLNPDTYTLILGTGANSANNHIAFLNALKHSDLPKLQIVVLCGKSNELLDQISAYRQNNQNHKIVPLPYLENPSHLFQSADALVCRPGTGLTSEAILCGIPIIHNTLGGTMPQEAITLAFCKKYNLSQKIKKASTLPKVVKEHLVNPNLLKKMRTNLQNARPQTTPAKIISNLQLWHQSR